MNQKLYWTDYCDDDIEVYDPVTRVRRVLFDVDLTEPRAIVVDPTTGWVLYKYKKQLNKLKKQIGMVGPKLHKQEYRNSH